MEIKVGNGVDETTTDSIGIEDENKTCKAYVGNVVTNAPRIKSRTILESGLRYTEGMLALLDADTREEMFSYITKEQLIRGNSVGFVGEMAYVDLGGSHHRDTIGLISAFLTTFTKIDDEMVDSTDISGDLRAIRDVLDASEHALLHGELSEDTVGARMALVTHDLIQSLEPKERAFDVFSDAVRRGWKAQLDSVRLKKGYLSTLTDTLDITRRKGGEFILVISIPAMLPAESDAKITDEELSALFDWGEHLMRIDHLCDVEKDLRDGILTEPVLKALESDDTGLVRRAIDDMDHNSLYNYIRDKGIDRSFKASGDELGRLETELVNLPLTHGTLRWLFGHWDKRYAFHSGGRLNAVEGFAKDVISGDRIHGIGHIRRVITNAVQISEREGGNMELIKAMAWLHDLGRIDGRDSDAIAEERVHSGESARRAKQILAASGYTGNEIGIILDGIEHHSLLSEEMAGSIEGNIFHDADKLDELGAIGITRANRFLEQKGIPISKGLIYMVQGLKRMKFRTETGKGFGELRMKMTNDYIDELLEDLNRGILFSD